MKAVRRILPLDLHWPTMDPFLFCAHHRDLYPAGNGKFGPQASLVGRNLGQDFQLKDGWRMYHGQSVPGFPPHPHRGFETVTIVREGYVDHSDSLGARARFGQGDIQWLTTGAGIVHSEMFPLIRTDRGNPLELFQIWLNLEKVNKFAAPYFSMYWAETIPLAEVKDADGRSTRIKVYAGQVAGAQGVEPPPESYAARPDAGVAIYTVRLDPGARWELPAAAADRSTMLYFFQGNGLQLGGQNAPSYSAFEIAPGAPLTLQAGAEPCELLVLQGRPMAEPVVQYGPFVMNASHEIEEAISDYRRTGFGGWPFPSDEFVHGAEARRFAVYPDGRTVEPSIV